MSRTQVRSKQLLDGEIKRPDLNVLESGSAVIAKLNIGTSGFLSLSSTGADTGTGDVTIDIKVADVLALILALG